MNQNSNFRTFKKTGKVFFILAVTSASLIGLSACGPSDSKAAPSPTTITSNPQPKITPKSPPTGSVQTPNAPITTTSSTARNVTKK